MRRASVFMLAAPLALIVPLMLGACAAAPPTDPTAMALPAAGKSFPEFQQDDADCRLYAQQSSGNLQQRYDAAYEQCMYAHGDQFAAAPGDGYPPDDYVFDPPYYYGPVVGLGFGFDRFHHHFNHFHHFARGHGFHGGHHR